MVDKRVARGRGEEGLTTVAYTLEEIQAARGTHTIRVRINVEDVRRPYRGSYASRRLCRTISEERQLPFTHPRSHFPSASPPETERVPLRLLRIGSPVRGRSPARRVCWCRGPILHVCVFFTYGRQAGVSRCLPSSPLCLADIDRQCNTASSGMPGTAQG